MEREGRGRGEHFAKGKRLNFVARSVAAVGIAAAGAGIINSEKQVENVEAQTPYTQNVNVDGHTVTIWQDAGATQTDVNRVRDNFVNLVNNSTVMRNRVNQAAPINQTQFITVSRNRVDVGTAGADDNSNTVFIDIADVDAVGGPYLKPQGSEDAVWLSAKFLDVALAHEYAHLLGIPDPQTAENDVVLPLYTIERNSYEGYCRQDGEKVIPYNIGEQPGVALVELNLSTFIAEQEVGGLFPGGSCAVGGVAELPEVSELPQNTTSEKSEDNTIPIAAGIAGAAAAVTAAGALLYSRRNRSAG